MRRAGVFASLSCLAVTCSGASALTLEILWQRQLHLSFGASAPATTAVLTAIFLGIAFGSLIAGRMLPRIGRPLRIFAAVEAGIGLWGGAVPLLVPIADGCYRWAATGFGESSWLLAGFRFVLSAGLLFPAALGMGATLPLMLGGVPTGGRLRPAAVYGWNTVGAVCGSLVTGLLLVRWFGTGQAYVGALVFSGLGSLLGLAADRFVGAVAVDEGESRGALPGTRDLPFPPDHPCTPVRLPCRGLRVAYFLAGAVALGLEVVWLRFLGIVSSSSTITFSFSLAAYLLGMGCGSLVLYPLLRRVLADKSVPGQSGVQALRIFSLANLTTGLLTLATWPVLHHAAALNYEWITVPAATGVLTLSHIYQTEALLVFGLMFLPALSMGLVYPAVCDAAEGSELSRSRWAGTAAFPGTLGAAAGVLLMSVWVIPALGLHGSLALLISSAVGLGLWIRPRSEPFAERGLRAAVAVIILAGAGWIAAERRPALREFGVEWHEGAWHEVSLARPGERVSRIERFRAGPTGTVIIKEKTDGGDRLVCVDDQLVASTNLEARVDALMLAHLPLLLHPNPRSELTVGFGSGGTSYAITTHEIDAWCVEIEPEVPRAAELLTQQNLDVLGHPRFRLIINDARDHLIAGQHWYDVIATDVTNLQYRQNSSLYTVEYFQRMQGRLNPGGIACAWIPLAAISTDELRILMRGFQTVFPPATLWFLNHTHTNFGILIGTPQPLRVDYRRLESGMAIPAVRENLARISITDPLQVIHSLHLDETGYRRFCGSGVLHTDDNPVLEFSSPLSFHQYNLTFRQNLAETLRYRPADLRPFVTDVPNLRAADWNAQATAALNFCRVLVCFYDVLMAQGRGDMDQVLQVLGKAVRLAEAGIAANPADGVRERFYSAFFEQAQRWLQAAAKQE
jgi:spermidine synthase